MLKKRIYYQKLRGAQKPESSLGTKFCMSGPAVGNINVCTQVPKILGLRAGSSSWWPKIISGIGSVLTRLKRSIAALISPGRGG